MTPLILLLSFLPGFIWLFFFLEEDNHPEPKSLLALVFLVGALNALIIAYFGTAVRAAFFPLEGIETFSLSYLTIAALIEEVGKFLIIFFLVRRWSSFDEPVDAMVYMIVGALGFATLENVAYLSQEATVNPFLGSVVEVASLRFVGSTLLHALCSGLVGYFWALSIRRFGEKYWIIIGLVLATALHTYFNYLIINYVSIAYITALLLFAGFFILNDFEELKWRSV